ncbi:MAG: DUF4332 domain-containing protein [Thermoplasmatota archaeon]
MADLTILPTWAVNYLNENLTGHTHVINALPIDEGKAKGGFLVNTSQGAVLLVKGRLGDPRHWFLPLPARHFSFICHQCMERIEFVDPDVPRTVYCTHCGCRYLLSMVDGKMALRREQGTGNYQPEPEEPAKETTFRVAKPAPAKPAAPAKKPATAPAASTDPYQQGPYTLYRRETEKKGGGTTTFYFFAKNTPKSGEPCAMPEGYKVEVNARTKLPYLRRKGASATKRAPAKTAKKAAPAKAAKKAAPYMDFKGDIDPILDVEGIGPVYAKKLEDAGIKTTARLSYESPAKIAKVTGAPLKTVKTWKANAELMKISGVGKQYAEVMARAGIHGIDDLKRLKADTIAKRIQDYVDGLETNVLGTTVTAKRVEGWQKKAAPMRRVRQSVPAE